MWWWDMYTVYSNYSTLIHTVFEILPRVTRKEKNESLQQVKGEVKFFLFKTL